MLSLNSVSRSEWFKSLHLQQAILLLHPLRRSLAIYSCSSRKLVLYFNASSIYDIDIQGTQSLWEFFSAEISWNGSHQFFCIAKLFFHIILLAPCLPSTSGKAASTSLLALYFFTPCCYSFFVLQWDTEEPSLYTYLPSGMLLYSELVLC